LSKVDNNMKHSINTFLVIIRRFRVDAKVAAASIFIFLDS
jgi:hypothetical protein